MDIVNYEVFYEARYEYEDVVTTNDNTLKVVPYDGDNQVVIEEKVETEPAGYVTKYRDILGNSVYRVKIIEPHYSMVIRSTSKVRVKVLDFIDCELPCIVHEPMFTDSTKLINVEYFKPIADKIYNGSKTLDEVLHKVVSFVNGKVKYREGVTNVDTPAHKSFEIGLGVCQDIAQITIGILRAMGFPARYVMGVVHDNPRTTHAWIEVKTPNGWVPIDPTRKRFYSEIKYIKFAIGRDYYDASPIVGTFVSKGRGWLKKLTVGVKRV
ncbi:transglutaminase family protein [Stygiolobus caldivivus]|uniref:Transglutaminase n=1 Tax=Stygiolobus caldivivus TaxID=2824673 RepID=A0A8D5U9A0_9CREN|nr:transglutaminase family protein [Stygiolobus caldivivus]BCU71607.1 transglutaminase [Stygiolobus caldivivus]